MTTDATVQQVDLTRFAYVDDGRESIRTPWSAGEHSFASDGWILIRVPRRDDIPERDNAPNVEGIFRGASPMENLRPMPAVELPAPRRCRMCSGMGWMKTCGECDGDGVVACDECGHESDCDECGSIGTLSVPPHTAGAYACSDCRGAGVGHDGVSVQMAPGLILAANNVVRLRGLPGLRINLDRSGAGDMRAVAFAFDGGDGVVMPRGAEALVHINAHHTDREAAA